MKNKKVEIEYNGKLYKSIEELAQDNGKNPARIRDRLRKGWDLKRAVESDKANCTSITYNGRKYRSIKEMSDNLNIPYTVLRSRLYSGYSPDEAGNIPYKKITPINTITYMGTTYPSLSALTKQLGISRSAIEHQIRDYGLSMKEAVTHCIENNHSARLFGKDFISLAEVAKQYDLNISMLYWYLKNGMTLDEAVTKMTAKEPVIYEGKSYNTIADLCQAYSVQFETFQRMRRNGATFKQALSWKPEPSTHGKGLSYNGVFYASRLNLCDEYKLNALLVRSNASKLSGMSNTDSETFLKVFKMFLEIRARAKLPNHIMLNCIPYCTFKGVLYNTLSCFLEEIGLSPSKLSSYKNIHDIDDTTQALIGMQKKTKSAYKIRDNCFSRKELVQKGLRYSEIRKYKKCKVMAYPQLIDIDFIHDFIDLHKIYIELRDKLRDELRDEILGGKC